ncbi:MAG: hypothetical protein QF596_01930 [Acidimicrobiales bacterium]|jgi:hypothetical protein|nr:hypothetical protein [Acidimicrobiales bacterium]MDP6299448.1 hypothetical protein [Acidimicrobiales bacterium]HJM28808.1 hypothetical protein [Acidimicrobiales bacterium]
MLTKGITSDVLVIGGMRISAELTLEGIAGRSIASGKKEKSKIFAIAQQEEPTENNLKILPFG